MDNSTYDSFNVWNYKHIKNTYLRFPARREKKKFNYNEIVHVL